MSAVSSTFGAYCSVHSEERAISLSLKVLPLPYQPRLARNRFRSGNSVRPIHLFGHTFDHDYYFELPREGGAGAGSVLAPHGFVGGTAGGTAPVRSSGKPGVGFRPRIGWFGWLVERPGLIQTEF